jgi:hypothetical protein
VTSDVSAVSRDCNSGSPLISFFIKYPSARPRLSSFFQKDKIDFRVIRNFNDGKRAALFADS